VTPLVEFRRVGFSYPRRSRATGFAIHDLSFTVEPGEILGVIGPNGSGKSTLIRLLSRVHRPAQGEILFEGVAIAGLSRAALATRIAVVPQDVPQGFPYTVEDLVLMGRFPHAPGRLFESARDVGDAREAMAATGVLELCHERLDRLSGGERQRVMLARALAQRPRLLVLDEPTAHLDLRHQADCVGLLRRLNREQGLGVVLVSHDLDMAAEVSDRLLLLNAGAAVCNGSVEAVMRGDTLQAVYGCRVLVDTHPVSGRPTVQIVWPTG